MKRKAYSDPTSDAAVGNLRREERHRSKKKPTWKRVYICSPYAGNVKENVRRAKAYCRFAVGKGFDPFAAHLFYTRFLRDSVPEERQAGMKLGLARINECWELWVFGDTVSSGMRAEIEYAQRLGKPIRYFTTERPAPKENVHGQNG